VICSPTEPPKLRAIATHVTTRLESRFGSDLTFRSRDRWVGIQRKELKDLIASVNDGRLGQNLMQMNDLDVAVLLIEGEAKFTLEGELVNHAYGRGLTRAQYRGVLWSAQSRGIWVCHTKNLDETVEWVQQFEAWCSKDRHTSLIKREPVLSPWGKPGNAEYARHLLMGLPGVGVELADRILAKFGSLPWQWTCTMDELMQVEGLGKVKAKKIMEVFG